MDSVENIADEDEIEVLAVENGVKTYITASGNTSSVRQFHHIRENNPSVLAEKKSDDQRKIRAGITNHHIFGGKILKVFPEEKAILVHVDHQALVIMKQKNEYQEVVLNKLYERDIWIDIDDKITPKLMDSLHEGKMLSSLRVKEAGTKTYSSFIAKVEIFPTVHRFQQVSGTTDLKSR